MSGETAPVRGPVVPATSPGAADVEPPRGRFGRHRSVLVGTVGTMGLNGATLVLNFVLVLVLARALGVDEFGAYAVAFAWSRFLSVPATAGLNAVVVREVAAFEVNGQWGLLKGIVRRSQEIVFVLGCAIAAGAAVVAWIVHRDDADILAPLLISLLIVPLAALTVMRQSAMQGLHRVLLGRLPDAVVMPSLLVALVLVGYVVLGDKLSAAWAAGATVVSAVVVLSLGGVLLWRALPRAVKSAPTETDTRGWLRSAVPLLPAAILTSLGAQIGTILVGALGTTGDAGVYNTAFRTALFAGFVYLGASYPLMPAAARLWATGEVEQMERLLRKSGRSVLLASIAIGAPLVVLAEPILRLFGAEFQTGADALRIIVVGQVLAIATGFGGIALLMTGSENAYFASTAVGVATTVLLTLVLTPTFGVNGAAFGFAAGMVVGSVVGTVLLWTSGRLYVSPVGARWVRRRRADSASGG